jgi:hypothetical protein
MKKIIFYLSIAFAIFSPNSLCAHDTELQSGCKIAEHECAFDYAHSNSDLLFFDICLEDLTDDDSNDSERKKHSSGKKAHSNVPDLVQNFLNIAFIKVFPTHFLFLRSTPLFIFIKVFRL